MHFRFLAATVASLLLLGHLQAQSTDSKDRTRKTASAAKVAPTPIPAPAKKPGFFSRLFGSRRAEPAATPAPTPAPTPRSRRTSRSTTKAPPKPETDETEEPKPSKPSKPVKSADVAEKPAPEAPAPPAVKTKSVEPPVDKLAASEEKEAADKAKFAEAKQHAMEDAKVADLKKKAENAPSEEEARKDFKAYNRALYQKMRGLEPGLKSRIDRMESAVMKQLDSAGPTR